jgi:hypothetical protein
LYNFDSTYDAGLYYGMQQFGIPIKFSSWHTHSKNLSSTSDTVQIHERARSIKMALAMVTDIQKEFYFDTGRSYHAVNASPAVSSGKVKYLRSSTANSAELTAHTDAAKISEYQFRIGGKYYPAQPVDCSKGGAEAYCELLKTLDAVGAYNFTPHMDPYDWSSDLDLKRGDKFLIAAEFEAADSNPDTISGINGEEQSDIMLQIKTEGNAEGFYNKQLNVFVAYDALLIVRPENTVELVM